MAVVKLFLRFVLIAGILAYFFAAAGLLATRYWLLPRIDQWRPEIQQAISRAVGTPVRFDAISADWRGLNANLKITNLTILDENGVAQLGVPTTDVIVSWRSLFSLEPIFRYVGVDDVILVARRSAEGQLYVAGFDTSSDEHEQAGFWQSPTMRWLLKQGRVNIENSRLVWVDQQRNAVPLVLEDIDITIDNGLLGHKLAVKVALPRNLGGNLEMVADIDAVQGSLSRYLLDEPDGYIYADVSELYPQALQPWLDLPPLEGSLAGRLWLDVRDGKFTNFTVSLAGRDTRYIPSESDQAQFTLGQFRWQAAGPLALLGADVQLPGLIEVPKSSQRVSSSVSLENVYLNSPMSGMQPLVADQISADLSVSKSTPEGLRVDIRDMAFANPDGLVTARGSWLLDSQGKGGRLDINGTLARFKLTRLHHYLPDTMGEEAHTWLSKAFTAGIVPQASFEIVGLVDDFPFSASRGAGTFRVDGTVQDWAIDYSPAQKPEELPWPPLADLNGTLTMLNDRITVDIASGALSLPQGERINLSALSAELIDLESDALLTIKGQTSADADDYLALFKGTALRDIAPEFLRDFSGTGQWDMPLRLRVPLNDVDSTSFAGELAFNGGTVAYGASPPLTDLAGVALLSEAGFESKGLSGKLLGGAIKMTGGINDKLDTIETHGKLAWAEIAKETGSSLVGQWFAGQLPLELNATVKDDTFDVVLASDFSQTQIKLPAPLALSPDGTAKVNLRWQGYLTGDKADNLSLSIANRLSVIATAASRNNAKTSPFFNKIGIAIGSAKPLPDAGLTINAQVPTIVFDQWMPAIEAVQKELQGAPAKGPGLMPGLTRAQIQAKEFVMGSNRLENLVADLSVKNGRQHTVKITSSQTNGTVQWALDQGKLQDGYHVRLDRLDIGNHDNGDKSDNKQASHDASALPEPGALSNLPDLDIEIEDLTLFGARLGELKISGRNSTNQKQWDISNLQITNPYAQLTASGNCRFNDNPGVKLGAELKVTDLGELTKFLGQGEQVRKGSGTIKADIEWQRFPWHFDYAGMSGKAQISLQEGVFDHVNSSSARMLELLSMQSLNRILNANINPDESFSQGFPWNSIAGTFDITKGVVDTQDLAVNSPVATISLTGTSSIVNETWDLQAVVRPNLDMSGTALATGFLVNPIVGLSALVGQYLLRNPVEAALSQRYHVGGAWDDPKITEGSNPNNKSNND